MASVVEVTEPAPFGAKLKRKLAQTQEKASRDFRSDVVTVPTEDMMSVGNSLVDP